MFQHLHTYTCPCVQMAYHRQARAPTWTGFLTELAATNADLAKQVTRAKSDHADYQRMGVFTP